MYGQKNRTEQGKSANQRVWTYCYIIIIIIFFSILDIGAWIMTSFGL